ncbi:MAG: hypothetical protein U5L06_08385 [Rhodovibrio sp.]|nr:hypothetical protein [Rhodovibrio sp.]
MRMILDRVVSSCGLLLSTSSAPSLLIVPGVDGAAGFLGDRAAFTRDRRLVDPAGAGPDDAVERNALARLDHEPAADRHGAGVDDRLAAVRGAQAHGLRRKVEQRLHRPAGARDAPAFQQQRQREQKGDGGGLEPLPDGDRARDRDHHQQVDIRAQQLRRIDRLDRHVASAAADREGVRQDHEPGQRRARGDHRHLQADAQQKEDAAERRQQRLHAVLPGPGRLGGVAAGVGRGHAGAADGPAHRVRADVAGLPQDHHAALEHVEGELVGAADNRADLLLQKADLLGTAQPLDIEGVER